MAQFQRIKTYRGLEARLADLVHGRISEANIAIRTAFWGAYVFFTPPSMAGPSYDAILRVATERQISGVAFAVGVIYLIALRINGGKRTATTAIRALAAALILSLWVALLAGFFQQVPHSTAVPAYFAFIVIPALFDFGRAFLDAARSIRGVAEVSTWSE